MRRTVEEVRAELDRRKELYEASVRRRRAVLCKTVSSVAACLVLLVMVTAAFPGLWRHSDTNGTLGFPFFPYYGARDGGDHLEDDKSGSNHDIHFYGDEEPPSGESIFELPEGTCTVRVMTLRGKTEIARYEVTRHLASLTVKRLGDKKAVDGDPSRYYVEILYGNETTAFTVDAAVVRRLDELSKEE